MIVIINMKMPKSCDDCSLWDKAAIDEGVLYGVHSDPEDTFREDFGGSR